MSNGYLEPFPYSRGSVPMTTPFTEGDNFGYLYRLEVLRRNVNTLWREFNEARDKENVDYNDLVTRYNNLVMEWNQTLADFDASVDKRLADDKAYVDSNIKEYNDLWTQRLDSLDPDKVSNLVSTLQPTVNKLDKSPSPIDIRYIQRPAQEAKVRDAFLDTAYNKCPPGTDTWAVNAKYHGISGGGTMDGTRVIFRNQDTVKLYYTNLTSYYSSLMSLYSGNSFFPFVVGNYYRFSFYIENQSHEEHWFWMRSLANTGANGHGHRFVEPGQTIRTWTIKKASGTAQTVNIDDPTVGFTSGNGLNPTWFFRGASDSVQDSTWNPRIGGLMIEDLGSTMPNVGIAAIGDSTIQGASGYVDSQAARETMGYLAGLLNTNTYNRGIGGNKLLDMVNRYATDIRPLKNSAQYCIIQGGINDIGGTPIADMQSQMQQLHDLAKADGFTPVILNVTPTVPISQGGGDPKRVQFNNWIADTFPNMIDIASVVTDPYDATLLRRTEGDNSTGWRGDGTHYTQKAKRAIAERIAQWEGWNFPAPAPYKAV